MFKQNFSSELKDFDKTKVEGLVKNPGVNYLSPDKSPIFENGDDVDGDEFVNANDPERKFVKIEDVADPDSLEDKEESEDNLENQEEIENEIEEENDVEEVRREIKEYTYEHRGSSLKPLESFHIDNEKGEMIGISGQGKEKQKNVIQEVDQEIVYSEQEEKPRYAHNDSGERAQKKYDNLKTWDDSKKERASRSLIRKIWDRLN